MTIQDDSIARIDVNKGEGCIIRLKRHEGTKIVVTEKLNIEISSSSKIIFTLDDLYIVRTLTEKCIKYMRNINNVGYPDEAYKKTKTISASKQKDIALYKDSKGRGIFIVGEAFILRDNYGASSNRQGAKYIRGIVNDINCIKSISMLNENTVNIITDGSQYVRFDTYATKPTGIIQEVWSMPVEYVKQAVNTILVDSSIKCVFRR